MEDTRQQIIDMLEEVAEEIYTTLIEEDDAGMWGAGMYRAYDIVKAKIIALENKPVLGSEVERE